MKLIESAKLAFFRSFFRLLIGFVALSEWTSIAWLLAAVGVHPPLAVHVVVPLAIFEVNRRIVTRRRARGAVLDALLPGYVAFAFTSIFCAVFLLVAGLGALPLTLVPGDLGVRLREVYGWFIHGGFFLMAGLLAYGYVFGTRELTVSRLVVPVPGLASALDGLRIVHLSDLHIGQHLDLDQLRTHIERVNALDPHLVCVTGDLVDRAETCELAFPTLAGLAARHAVLVTLGNHDFYAGADTVTETLRKLTPFTVLRDESVRVEVDGTALTVVGVDDLGLDWARGVPEHPALPGLAAAVPEDDLLIVLSHRPDCFEQAARLGASLMLAGHTHGGQIALPSWLGRRGRNLAEFITRFNRGLYRHGEAALYVNRGLGFTGQKVRLFTPREIVCIELRAVAS